MNFLKFFGVGIKEKSRGKNASKHYALDALNWMCHSCGDMRPDEKISVFSYPIPGFFGAVRNWRYCNDRPTCYAKAQQASTVGPLSASVNFPKKEI